MCLLRAIFPPSKEARGRLYSAASKRTARREANEVGSPSNVTDLKETDGPLDARVNPVQLVTERIAPSKSFNARFVLHPSSLYAPETAERVYWLDYLRYEYSPWCPTPPFPFPIITPEKGTSPSTTTLPA